MVNYLVIEHISIVLNNPQYNAPVERVHKLIVNMLVTKYLDNKVFKYMYSWGETLVAISCAIRESHHRPIGSTPVQDVFGRDIIFNLESVIY